MAPPEDYVETCTVESYQTGSVECGVCQAIRAGYDNSDRCPRLLEAFCYENVRSAWGGVSYAQVWCRAKSVAGEDDKYRARLALERSWRLVAAEVAWLEELL